MLAFAIAAHSVLRWIVLGFGVYAVGRALTGRTSGRPWTPADARAGLLFSLAFDTQFLLGLILYFTSPITRMGVTDMGTAMTSSVMRFFTVEHPVAMLIAIGLVHMGRSRLRRATNDRQRHRRALVFFGLAVLLIVAAIPWPFLPYGRPWITWP